MPLTKKDLIRLSRHARKTLKHLYKLQKMDYANKYVPTYLLIEEAEYNYAVYTNRLLNKNYAEE